MKGEKIQATPSILVEIAESQISIPMGAKLSQITAMHFLKNGYDNKPLLAFQMLQGFNDAIAEISLNSLDLCLKAIGYKITPNFAEAIYDIVDGKSLSGNGHCFNATVINAENNEPICETDEKQKAILIVDALNLAKAQQAKIDWYELALKEISKAEGAYSKDPLTHAQTVISRLTAIANATLDIHYNG